MQPYEKYLKENSQKLRMDQTDAERKLWQRINRDQIIHWSIMNILEPYFMKGMYHYSCASIKGRGIYYGSKYLKKILNIV